MEGVVDRLNVVLIVVDALRAQNLGIYGYHKDTSPNIDWLGKRGVVFDNAFSCINTTDPSVTSIFTGRYPISHGIINHGTKLTQSEVHAFLRRNIKTLPEILKSNGYITLALDWLGRWHRKGFQYYMGIDSAAAQKSGKTKFGEMLGASKRLVNGLYIRLKRFLFRSRIRSATNVTRHAIKVMGERLDRRNPFFLFVHYWDTHTPYNAPKRFEKRFFDEDDDSVRIEDVLRRIKNPEWREYLRKVTKGAKTASEIIARYDGAIAYVDEEIGVLMDFLEKQGVLDESVVILTSDHGESLTEHDIFFDHHGLYDVTIRVPLIIWCPSMFSSHVRVSSLVQHVDLVPTVLDILNIGGRYGFDGESLLPLIGGKGSCSPVCLCGGGSCSKEACN